MTNNNDLKRPPRLGELLHYPCDDTQQIIALHNTVATLVKEFGAEWICELARDYEEVFSRKQQGE